MISITDASQNQESAQWHLLPPSEKAAQQMDEVTRQACYFTATPANISVPHTFRFVPLIPVSLLARAGTSATLAVSLRSES